MSDEYEMPSGAVAVVGMALRVPGAATLDAFWRNLRDGIESISRFSTEELLVAGAGPQDIADPHHVPAFGALAGIEDFDAGLFGFAPREAQLLDPQHRLFLECAWEALEHAGHPADTAQAVIGVYGGVGESSYFHKSLLAHPGLVERIGAFQTSLGNDKDFVPTRVSYKLDLTGPSVSVQTGCSTSLVAVHMAVQALLSGECDLALAGGATVDVLQRRGYRYEPGGVMSADGHCRAFDAAASGAVPASGAGIVVLKRLADALADRDVIHAVIRGSAINNDGARKVGFTAPSVDGQADVIAEALAVGDVDPATISYVEAHGTGTPLGDPIEVAALASVFRGAAAAGAIALGSVKTNVGHLDTAAGVVGLIKTVLAMKARELPPSLHLQEPNPQLELQDGLFRIAKELQPWHAPVLRAGVSSFGIGGTNAHVVLEQAPAAQGAAAAAGSERRRAHVLPLSAASPAALEESVVRLREHLLASAGRQDIDDVAFTLQNGRWALPHRHFVIAADLHEAVDALGGAAPSRPAVTGTAEAEVAFTFPGQGAQCVDAGVGLYRDQPGFRDAVDQIAELFVAYLGTDLRDTLYPDASRRAEATERITRTDFAQPALFTVEYALAQLWLSWGVQPVALLGHSIGELTAACLAGVFSLEDAVRIVAARGRLMHAAVPGEMLAVPLSEAEVIALLGDELSLAAVNGPRQCTVSGPSEPIAAFAAMCAERGIEVKRLKTSHAFHSASMDSAAEAFAVEVARVRLHAPQIPFVSNVSGTWITEEQATSPAYWAQQLRSTVRFQDGLMAVHEVAGTLLEVGPGRVLTSLSGSVQQGGTVASLPSAFSGGEAERDVLAACGQLWCLGVPVAWQAIETDGVSDAKPPRHTELPTYPFQRERCWVDAPRSGSAPVSGLQGGLSVRAFSRTAPVAARTGALGSGAWLLLGENALLGPVEQRLRAAGVRVVTVDGEQDIAGVVYALPPGKGYGEDGDYIGDGDVLAPVRDLTRLRALSSGAQSPVRVVVLTAGALDVTGEEQIDPRGAALSEWARQDPNGSRLLVDASVPNSPASLQRLAALIWAEITAIPEYPVVALRGGHRFVPTSAPLVAADRTADQRFALFPSNLAIAGSFSEALTQGDAMLCDLSELNMTKPGTALVLLDSRDGAGDCARSLWSAAVGINAFDAETLRACEIHILAPAEQDPLGSSLVAALEAQVAVLGREAVMPWTSFVWPSEQALASPELVASAVGASGSGCSVVVSAPELLSGAGAGDVGVDRLGGETEPSGYEDETERAVAAIFADLLGLHQIPVTSGFFELGGHSLLAAQVVAHVRRECEADVLLSEFIDEPTIQGLAGAVRRAREAARPLEHLPAVIVDPAAADQPFPLTDVQQAYWIGRTGVFDLGNVGMHGYEEYDAAGMDLPRLQDALRKLIARHGMLRAVFLPDGEQRILAEVPDYVIVTEDARGLSPQDAAAVTERTRATMSHQVFVPDQWPLFEMRATLLDADVTRVHFSVDGLITDAWAFQLMMSELVHLYQHPDVALPELELSFRDYVLAEQSLESTERYRRAAEYWQERIPDFALAPDLPLACDPGSIGAPRFERLSGELSEPEWSRIKVCAAGRNLTPTALLLTAYSEVLATWSKQRRFTLNLPMANRLPLHPQVEEIIGDFTSVTLLEVDAGGEATFEARAAAVRDRLVSDLDHRLYSGVKVLRELKRRRGDAAGAMPVVFTSLFTNHGGDAQLGEVVYSISQTPQIWIDAQVFEAAGALVLDIDSVEGLFPAGMVRAIHDATLDLLRRLAADEGLWSRPVPILVPRAELEQREQYNRTEGPTPDGLLHEAFFAAAAAAPERPAVITAERTLDYGELAGHALAVAGELRRLSPAPGDLVAVVMEKGWEQCAAVLGVLAAGAAYLPIDPDLPAERIENLLSYSRARAVLTQSWLVEAGRVAFPDDLPVVEVDTLGLAAEHVAGADVVGDVRPEDLAYVIFTSGSTGQPKGVMIDHRGALNTIADINERFGVSPEDRVLGLSSLSFDLSVYDIFGPLSIGAALVLPGADRQRDPVAWRELMAAAPVTVWNSVPALMELLVEHLAMQEATLPALRLVMLSGDWIPVTLPDRVRRVAEGAQVVSLGGATEASIWSILHPIGDVPEDWTSIPYGRPMRNQTFHVLDDALRPRPVGVPGQMYIGGVGVAMGYLRDGVRTKASFLVHPESGERLYRTGDLGRFLPSGEIEFLGREDFQVKVQGYRIELGEIEAALVQHPAIRAAVVVADGAPRGAKRLVAFVVLQEDSGSGGAPTVVDLRDFLGGKLPHYMVPGVYVDLDALPLTANGKVDRRALVVPREAVEATQEYEAPGTRIEEIVAEVWSNLLQVERVGVHDDFFDIGGDSLLAMRAVVHLRKAFDIDLSIHVLFDRRTPRELSLAVEDLLLAEIEAMPDDDASVVDA